MFDEKLEKEVYNISKDVIKYSEKNYRFLKYYRCKGISSDQCIGQLTLDYQQAMGTSFKLYSLLETLVQHMMCKWLIEIQFEFNDEDFKDKETFLLDPLPIEGDINLYGYLVPIEETHLVEILTAYRVVKKQVYFSFLYLFSFYVWLSICLTVLCFGILWRVSTDSRITLHRAITDLMRGLTGQTSNSTHLWSQIRNSKTNRFLKWIVFQQLLYIWLIVSTFLSKSMSSVLLQTYIDANVQPIVNSLMALIRNENIHIEGSERLKLVQNEISSQFWELLSTKIKNNKKMSRTTRILDSATTIRQILKGQKVQLDNSKNNREKILMFPTLPLTVGRKKYANTLFAFFISKEAPFAENITKLVKHAIESGFDEHQKLCDDLKSRIKGQIIRRRLGDQFTKMESAFRIQRSTSTLKLDDLTHGALMSVAAGYVLAMIALAYELITHYIEEVYLSVDGLPLKQLKDYTLTDGIRIETDSYDQVVLRFKKLSKLNKQMLHESIRQNYEIYFAPNQFVKCSS